VVILLFLFVHCRRKKENLHKLLLFFVIINRYDYRAVKFKKL